MAFKDVRQYFRDRLNALSDYREWQDGFDFENIPSSLLDKAYHIEIPSIASGPANSRAHTFTVQAVVRVYFSGALNVSQRIDDALDGADEIMAEVLEASNRLGTVIKDVRPIDVAINPLSVSNNNGVGLEISFECLIINCF